MRYLRHFINWALLATACCTVAVSADSQIHAAELEPARQTSDEYIIGPNDHLHFWALGAEELSDKTVRVDPDGDLDLPLIGKVHAGGLTAAALKKELIVRLRPYVKDPQVAISITQFQSQPVSLVGAVNNPGIQYLQGRKTLLELLSMGGGLRADAGHSIRITRHKALGKIPLENARFTEDGGFSVADVKVKGILAAEHPENNIAVMPRDVISVPRAEMVYVIGEVRKSGGIPLGENESISVLQALSIAEGMGPVAAASDARILRAVPGLTERTEIAVNIKSLLAKDGRTQDIDLRPNDILFIPSSTTKRITARAIEAGLSVGTGVLIWGR